MFEHGSDSKDSLQINPYYTSSLDHYKFAGRLVGLAVFHGHLIDGYFGLWFYRHILGKTVEIADLELMDPEYYRSLKWMRDNDIEGIIDNTFSIEEDVQGKLNTIDLKVDGHNISVTNKNKKICSSWVSGGYINGQKFNFNSFLRDSMSLFQLLLPNCSTKRSWDCW